MVDTKISALTAAAAAADANELAINEAGTSKKVSVAQIDTFISQTTKTLTNKTLTSPTLTTPAIGTPASGVLTNCTGLPTAGMVDNAVTLGKMATGTAGNLITYSAAGAPAAVATGTAAQGLTSNGAGAAPTFQAVGGGTGAFTDYIPCVMEVPNDTVSYPDIFTLVDAATKISGIWLPNSGTS